jgi:glycosyltransferase involved in cell wall biosynthesis
MNVLIVGPGCGVPIPPVGWGGIEKVAWKHCEYLRKNGHIVVIYNDRNHSDFINLIRNNQFDIIHAHEDWANDVLSSQNIPYVFTSHSGGWAFGWHIVEPVCQKAPFAALFTGMYNKIVRENKFEIWNGADSRYFFPEQKEKNMCLAVGLDQPRKKFDLIVDLIKDKKDFKLYIIGPGTERLQVSDNIFTMPNLPEEELSSYFRRSEYFFHLAEAEADALVVREAAMSGCKLILSDYCSEIIGREISWTDVNNFELCPDNLGELAYQKAKENFTWEKVGEKLVEIYNEVLKRR